MNAGIQDAWNLGWKIALVARGAAPRGLLDSYEAERLPVGRALLRFTDRLFSIATSTWLPVRTARTHIAPRVAPLLARLPAPLRAAGFRRVAELDVTYRRSPAVEDRRSWLSPRPHAGDRLPDATLSGPHGPTTLHRLIDPPGYHVLLLGPPAAWSPAALAGLRRQPGVTVHLIERGSAASGLRDATGEAWRRLRAGRISLYAVRPDGHLGFRADNADLGPLSRWLDPRRDPAG
jgi:hypothetical protein